jgi:NADH:ubiquinone reductase (non-electrogenic)
MNACVISDDHSQCLAGFAAFLIWRGGYLTKLGSWRNRLQVPFDWLKTLLFGRDVSQF